MVANYDNMLDTFNLCNMEFFEGKLLFPQFGLLHSYRTCGFFEYTKGGWFDRTLYDPKISITDYYDFTEKQFRDTDYILLHIWICRSIRGETGRQSYLIGMFRNSICRYEVL